MTNDLLNATDSGSPSLVVSLDLSAAFDCVSHTKLVDRLLTDFGVNCKVLSWIESYLSNRLQYVSYNGVKSVPVSIVSGVPQGSVLGPLFFTAYISPVARLIASFNLNHHTYADDTTLFLNFDEKCTPVKILNDCTSALANWFMFNGLLLNPSKSQVMWVGSRSQLAAAKKFEPHLKIASTTIESSETIKIVGVTFDRNLSFNDHISEVCKSSNFHLKALAHIRKSIDTSTATVIACSIVGSRIDYCNAVLSGVSANNIQRLQKVQNRAAKIVLNARGRTSTEPLLRKLHWLPVAKRIDFKIALTTFKTLTCHQPAYLDSLLIPFSSSRSLRSSSQNLLTVPFVKTKLQSRAFSVCAPKLWNSLPQHLRNLAIPSLPVSNHISPAPHLSAFKQLLKTFLFDAPPFSVSSG